MAQGFFAKLLMALLVLSFAAWGIGDIFRSATETTVATVDGESISQNELDMLIYNLQRAYPEVTPDVAADPRFKLEALDNLINSRLLKAEINELGLDFSRKTLAGYIAREPQFQKEDGSFDRARFQAALRRNNMSEPIYLARLSEDISRAVIEDTLALDFMPSDAMLNLYYQIQNEEREASIVLIRPKDIGPIKGPTEEELDELYETEQERFRRPEYRAIEYVSFSQDDVWNSLGLEPDEAMLQQLYEERKESYRVPEMREVSQLLFLNENAAKAVYEKLQAGTAFDELTNDPSVLNKDAISLGKVDYSSLPSETSEAVFALEKGTYSAPTASAFGWHIYYVTDVTPSVVKSYEEVQERLRKDYRIEQMEQAMHDLGNRIEDELAAGSTMQEAIQKVGLKDVKAAELGPVAADASTPKDTMLTLKPLQEAVLETALGMQSGETSSVQLTEDNKFYIVSLKEVIPSAIKPKDEVGIELQKLFTERAKQTRLQEMANEAADMLKNAENPKAAAREAGYSLHPTGKLKRMHDTITNQSQLKDKIITSGFVLELFNLKPHHVTGAYPLPSGEYAIGILENIHEAKAPKETDLRTMDTTLSDALAGDVIQNYLLYLRDKYDVEIKMDVLLAGAS